MCCVRLYVKTVCALRDLNRFVRTDTNTHSLTHPVHEAGVQAVGEERIRQFPEVLLEQPGHCVDVGLERNDLCLEIVRVECLSQFLHVPQDTRHSVDTHLSHP